ncbi:hypothetical protein [Caulobacter sp. 1776]|uniref:hypothetical protein n=1 Tax=Caulobacter sp. 1776 TaxID=3156420 RepID=UPI003399897D
MTLAANRVMARAYARELTLDEVDAVSGAEPPTPKDEMPIIIIAPNGCSTLTMSSGGTVVDEGDA